MLLTSIWGLTNRYCSLCRVTSQFATHRGPLSQLSGGDGKRLDALGDEQAVAAVNTLNGTDLGGRNMLVREDREDRDVKAFNRENGQCPPVWSRRTHSGLPPWST